MINNDDSSIESDNSTNGAAGAGAGGSGDRTVFRMRYCKYLASAVE